MEELEAAEGRRDDAAEAVGIEVEYGEIGKETELGRKESGDVGAVEVDGGHDG